LAEFANNSTWQQSIKMTPFKADIGYVPRKPLYTIAAGSTVPIERVTMRSEYSSEKSRAENAGTFATCMADILIELKGNITKAQTLQVAEANKHRRPHTFQEGNKVFISANYLPLR
jgi:hypothetical protein